jgi:hypothetical protein
MSIRLRACPRKTRISAGASKRRIGLDFGRFLPEGTAASSVDLISAQPNSLTSAFGVAADMAYRGVAL